MSRKATIGALAAVLAVSGASIASAGSDDDDGQRVIRLMVRTTGIALVENGQAGLNPGDRFVSSGDLLREGEKIGDAGLDCTVIRVHAPASLYSCVSGAALPGGQIAFQSLSAVDPANVSATAAVTGGTGRYRTAHGEATLSVPAAGGLGEVTIRLR
jgi:allene oxide cyclase-like protein